MTFMDAKSKVEDLAELIRDYDFKDIKELKDLADFRALLKKNEEIEEEKKNRTLIWILAIIGLIVVCAGIGYAVYRFLVPYYLEDSFDEFEDFDDDFFEDDDLTNWDDVDEVEVDKKETVADATTTEE